MKNLFTFIMVMLVSIGYSQSESKFYLGVGLGLATTGGDISSDNNYGTGLNLNFLNLGYRFNDTWGLTANLGSAGHAIDDAEAALGIGVFSIGPMISFSVSDNMTWDFKPQYAPSMKGKYAGDDAGIFSDLTLSGNAFVIGISQAIAMLPGISRSGATISTSVLLGNDKTKAARFSFLMVVPLIFGKIAKDILGGELTYEASNIITLSIGFVAAFVAGLFACTWMIALVKKSKLSYFAFYCVIVGIIAIGFSLFNN